MITCLGVLLMVGLLGSNFPLIYKGLIPAADCPGIEVTLVLNENGSFSEENNYIERTSFFDEGQYILNKKLLTTVSKEGDTAFYRVEKNILRRLDRTKNVINGPLKNAYILKKQNNEKAIDD